MLRTCLAIGLFIGPQFCTSAQPVTLKPTVDPRVELLSILARLADYPEYNQNKYKSYVDDIEAHFRQHDGHPAVVFMRQLRATNGISFDAVMGYAVQLDPPPSLQPLVPFAEHLPDSRWTAKDADSLAVLIRQFYEDTRCASFFQRQASRYKAAEAQFANIVQQIDLPWFQKYYGQPSTQQFHLVLGLANGNGNYGSRLRQPGGRETIYAIMGAWSTDSTGMANYPIDAYLPIVIHEFNHSFVNPLIESNWPNLEQPADLIFSKVREPMQRQAYASGKTMLCEALVRASVVVYLQQHDAQGVAARRQLREEQDRRFVWTDTLVGLLNHYEVNRSQYPTLQSFMPEHNAFYQRLAGRIDTVLRTYDVLYPRNEDPAKSPGTKQSH